MSEGKPEEEPAPGVPDQPDAPGPAQSSGPGTPWAGNVWAPPPDAVVVRAGSARRAPWWLVAVLVVVAAGVGLGAGALIWAGQVERVYPPGMQALTPQQYDKCVRGMTIFFNQHDPDPLMRAAAKKLRQDERIDSVSEETQHQAFDRFKKTFKDQPDLVRVAREEAMPASVNLLVGKGTTAKQLKAAMQAEFPDSEITVQDWCPPPE